MDKPMLHAKLKALSLHFLYSLALVGIAALLVQHWYPDWLFWLDGGLQVMQLIVPIDLVLGPLLMFVVFNPKKSFKEKSLDVGVVLVLQWAALGYGLWQAHAQRPLAVYFSGRELSSCPKTLYTKTNSLEPTHPVLDIQVLNPKADHTKKIMHLIWTYGVGECVLSQDMVPAIQDLEKFKKNDAVARKSLPKSLQKPQAGQVAAVYQGRYGRVALIFNDQTLEVLERHYLK